MHTARLERGDDVRLEAARVAQLDQQVEHDVRREAVERGVQRREARVEAELLDLVAERLEPAHHVVLGAPGELLALALARDRIARVELGVREQQHAELASAAHTGTRAVQRLRSIAGSRC